MISHPIPRMGQMFSQALDEDCPGSNLDFKLLYATFQTLSLLPCVLLFLIACPLNYDGE
jgi:hypothetical protein